MGCGTCQRRYVVPLAVTTDAGGAGSATLAPSAWPVGALDIVALGERVPSNSTGISVWTVNAAATRLYGAAPLLSGDWTEHAPDVRDLVARKVDLAASVTGGPISSTIYLLFVFTVSEE